jgi:hypothetical protein
MALQFGLQFNDHFMQNVVTPGINALSGKGFFCEHLANSGQAMNTTGGALDASKITTQAVTERLSRRLRRMIGPGRRWTFGGVAELTGIDERSLRAYAAGTACPNLAKYKRLLSVLGAELAAEVDLMHGWAPRALDVPPGAVDLEALTATLRSTLNVVEALLQQQEEKTNEEPKAPPVSLQTVGLRTRRR